MHNTLVNLLMILCSLLSAQISMAQSPIKNEIAFYVETYGEVTPEQDSKVALAQQIFDKVKAVADKSTSRTPKLVVVNSISDPWAIALPSGHIVVSKQAIEVCHQQADSAVIEARLAFVMGHELAHLAHDDFWHQEVYAFLSQKTADETVSKFLKSHQHNKERELAADDKGFIYAAIAGFKVDTLLKKQANADDFFNFWLSQTSAKVQTSHPQAHDRSALLVKRLQTLQDKLGFFYFGVRLSHFDYCDDAVYFLQEFQRVFPSREVLNNIGYCYLQMARQAMKPEHAYFYWMPLLLDGTTRAGGGGQRGNTTLKSLHHAIEGKALSYLNDAIVHLQRAAQSDPHYLPARINLAVAQLYLGKPHDARATIVEALELAPQDVALQTLEALALYEQTESGLDLWPNAIAKLETLTKNQNAEPFVLFNLARLYQVRPRAEQEKLYWQRLAEIKEPLPEAIQTIVCLATKATANCLNTNSKTAQTPPWTWPLSTKSFKQLTPQEAQQQLPNWQVTAFDWFKDTLHGHYYTSPDQTAEVLELDNFVQMQVIRGKQVESVSHLEDYCAQPLRKNTLAQGVVMSCDNWAALLQSDRVKEIWWIAK